MAASAPRLPIRDAEIAREFEVRRFTGCDGYPAAKVFDVVMVTTPDGREWVLPCAKQAWDDEDGVYFYRASYDAAAQLEAVQRRRSIDPALWVEMEPQPSLEERFAQYAEEEAMERAGFR